MADIELREWVALSERLTDADRARIDPPTEVWTAIVTMVAGIDPSDAYDSVLAEEAVVEVDRARTHKAPQALRRRRQRLLAGLALGLAAIVLGLSFLTGGGDAASLTAQATNDGLSEPYAGSATATVAEDGSTIRVEFTEPLPNEAPVEVWLVNSDSTERRSLGLVDDDTNVFQVPDDVDLGRFPIVDISIEPSDGNPAHSGRSILRGRFLAR